MEKNDKQINEKQIHSCRIPNHARPNTRQSELLFSGLSNSKSDSFHNGISTLVTENCTHSKEIQIKEACSGKTEREILSFYAYLTVMGKSLLAEHYWNLELISGSILEVLHPFPHNALYKIVTWLNLTQFSHILKIPFFNSASFWPPFFISKLCQGIFYMCFVHLFNFHSFTGFNTKYIFTFIF